MSVKNNITEGPITRTIFSLALPVVVGMLMEFALTSTDYFWVGKLGSTAQDAVTSSMVVIWTIFATISIVSVGVTALVARYVGAGDSEKVIYFIRQGIAMAVGLAVVFSVVGYLFSPALLVFMDTGPDTLELAVPYLRIFFVSAVFFFLTETAYAVFRASGDTRTPTKISIGVVVINMILDPLLIFGWGPVPSLGVAGASAATGIAVLLGATAIMYRMSHGGLDYQVRGISRVRPHLRTMLRIGRIGLPMSSQQFVFVSVYWFLIKIVHQFGSPAAAAMGIGNRMESFSYLVCYGFSVAAATMVGQNLGAGRLRRAARCAWGSTGAAIAITLITSALFISIPELIATIFTDDAEVLTIATDYLIILGLSQTAMAVEIVLEGAFSGAGDTVPPMVVMVPGSAMRIPMAYFLCFELDWGINGVWWTLTITTFLKAVVLALWFGRGKWKLKQV